MYDRIQLSTIKTLSRAAEETGPMKPRQPAEKQMVPIPALFFTVEDEGVMYFTAPE